MEPPSPTAREVAREVGFAVLALVSLFIGLYRIGDPDASIPAWVMVLDVLIGASFAADWAHRIQRSGDHRRYALRHAYEVVAFVPYTLIPQAAGADLLRGARLLRLLRFMRYGVFLKVGLGVSRLPRRLRYLRRIVRHAQIITLLLAGLLVVTAGASALLLLEKGVNPRTRGFPDAFWWSLNLFTTVAYEIPRPATPGGYVVSGLLMVTGIGFIGVFTASLANALLRTPEPEEEAAREEAETAPLIGGPEREG